MKGLVNTGHERFKSLKHDVSGLELIVYPVKTIHKNVLKNVLRLLKRI